MVGSILHASEVEKETEDDSVQEKLHHFQNSLGSFISPKQHMLGEWWWGDGSLDKVFVGIDSDFGLNDL